MVDRNYFLMKNIILNMGTYVWSTVFSCLISGLVGSSCRSVSPSAQKGSQLTNNQKTSALQEISQEKSEQIRIRLEKSQENVLDLAHELKIALAQEGRKKARFSAHTTEGHEINLILMENHGGNFYVEIQEFQNDKMVGPPYIFTSPLNQLNQRPAVNKSTIPMSTKAIDLGTYKTIPESKKANNAVALHLLDLSIQVFDDVTDGNNARIKFAYISFAQALIEYFTLANARHC